MSVILDGECFTLGRGHPLPSVQEGIRSGPQLGPDLVVPPEARGDIVGDLIGATVDDESNLERPAAGRATLV